MTDEKDSLRGLLVTLRELDADTKRLEKRVAAGTALTAQQVLAEVTQTVLPFLAELGHGLVQEAASVRQYLLEEVQPAIEEGFGGQSQLDAEDAELIGGCLATYRQMLGNAPSGDGAAKTALEEEIAKVDAALALVDEIRMAEEPLAPDEDEDDGDDEDDDTEDEAEELNR